MDKSSVSRENLKGSKTRLGPSITLKDVNGLIKCVSNVEYTVHMETVENY